MSAFRPTFVSHAHVDNDICDHYVAALRAHGIDSWYDRTNAQAGHFLGTDIQHELERRSAFVLLMTQAALDSFWVQLELQAYLGLMAQDRSRILLPVRIGPCAVPPFLNALFWIDAQAMPFEQAIDAIASALTVQDASPAPSPIVAPPPSRETLPPLGPAPAPANSAPAHHLTPMPLYMLGFRGYSVNGVECILPPICPVPAGVFIMGSDTNRDKQARDDETPQFPVEVDAFAIGQHPVTVAEYACAVRANAVQEPPDFDIDWPMQVSHLDHPVVYVTWNDAVTYVRWLAKLTGQPWRLPTEAEWEKAARGADGRTYPWGDTFDKVRCNTHESGIGATTPVGRYPNGEGPYHVQDMTGNVWEWTSSLFMDYPYRKNDGRESLDSAEDRTIRGGSRVLDSQKSRIAFRFSDGPDSVYGGVGFRLAFAASDP
jgi:formylglycine-generating enzyme required for sulfatase activity